MLDRKGMYVMTRRRIRVRLYSQVAGAIFLVVGGRLAASAERVTIDLDYVSERAKELSLKAYDDRWGRVPDFLRNLSYDDYHQIRFNPLRALWADDPVKFRIEFFHPGNVYNRAVRFHEFTSVHEQEIPFAVDFFDYGHLTEIHRRVPTSLGYAGFRVLYPLNKADRFDEVAVYGGASCFRVMARGQGYGLSARCLALNTTMGAAEEFPLFREFWLGKPDSSADQLLVYSLIDSTNVVGAYEFLICPGEETVVNVRARLFFRSVPVQVGLAPFSSMFFYGENAMHKPPDYRPEVHDSDGLLVFASTNHCVWRPLDNPASPRPARVYAFDQPVRFALMQRDRSFDHYQDIGAAYHLRPSALVELGPWGSGSLVFYTFPAQRETVDNVAVFWQPKVSPVAGVPYETEYALHFTSSEPSPRGIVVATRCGWALSATNQYECVVDFGGKLLAGLKDVDPVKAVVDAGDAQTVCQTILEKNNFNGTWRLFVRFLPPTVPQGSVFRAHLEMEGRVLTETWEYTWYTLMN